MCKCVNRESERKRESARERASERTKVSERARVRVCMCVYVHEEQRENVERETRVMHQVRCKHAFPFRDYFLERGDDLSCAIEF